jgi:hypothetical protein
MKEAMKKGKLDFILAFEFHSDSKPSKLHLLLSKNSEFLIEILTGIIGQFNGRLEIEIY